MNHELDQDSGQNTYVEPTQVRSSCEGVKIHSGNKSWARVRRRTFDYPLELSPFRDKFRADVRSFGIAHFVHTGLRGRRRF